MNFKPTPQFKQLAYRICDESRCLNFATHDTLDKWQLCQRHYDELMQERKEQAANAGDEERDAGA